MLKKSLVITTALILTIAVAPLGISAKNSDSQFYTLGDSNVHRIIDGVPFEIWGCGIHVEKTPFIEPIMADDLSLPAVGASHIHILQSSGHSPALMDGTVIGQINIFYSDTTSLTENLVIGINTAEWAYDRSDVSPYLQHTKIPPAYSFPEDDPSGGKFKAHLFYIGIATDPAKTLERIELVLDSELSATRDYLGAGIYAITIETTIEADIVPPGWNEGSKVGWDGLTPPGLNKNEKTPAGFNNGNKEGWSK